MKVAKWLAPLILLALGCVALYWHFSASSSQPGGLQTPVSPESASPSPHTPTQQSRSNESDEAENQADDSADNGLDRASGSNSALDWEGIDDVDEVIQSLTSAMESGDKEAAWQLHSLATICMKAAMSPRSVPAELQSTMAPERLAQLEADLERYAVMRQPCSNSEIAAPGQAMSMAREALWQAALEGHPQAQYEAVFNPPPPQGASSADQSERLAMRSQMLSDLRDSCHEGALRSIGYHLGRESRVTEGLLRESIAGHDSTTSRQIQAFAHRYAAATLSDNPQPARSARNEDHPLSAFEEQHAVDLGESLLDNCR